MDFKELVPILYSISNAFALPIERNFTPEVPLKFATDYGMFPIVLVSFYLLMTYFGPKLMKDKAAFDLKLPLAAWNAFLSLFSFIGMFRTVPFLLATVLDKPYEYTICNRPFIEGAAYDMKNPSGYGAGPVGFWVMLFIFSKIPELVDTVFIILRKKPLIFLHWYHHVTVLLYCWHAFATLAGTGLYFVAMNYSVHAVMYGYYCLQALNSLPKSFPTVLITIAQITQMFVGTGVCISAWSFKLSGTTCYNETSNLVAGGLMYGSYLWLFCDFAFGRYLRKSDKKGPKKIE